MREIQQANSSPSDSMSTDRLLSRMRPGKPTVKKVSRAPVFVPKSMNLYDLPGLNGPAFKVLRQIFGEDATISDLLTIDPKRLMAAPGCGTLALLSISRAMSVSGLAFRGTTPDGVPTRNSAVRALLLTGAEPIPMNAPIDEIPNLTRQSVGIILDILGTSATVAMLPNLDVHDLRRSPYATPQIIDNIRTILLSYGIRLKTGVRHTGTPKDRNTRKVKRGLRVGAPVKSERKPARAPRAPRAPQAKRNLNTRAKKRSQPKQKIPIYRTPVIG